MGRWGLKALLESQVRWLAVPSLDLTSLLQLALCHLHPPLGFLRPGWGCWELDEISDGG